MTAAMDGVARILAGYGFEVAVAHETTPAPRSANGPRDRACRLAAASSLPLTVIDAAMVEVEAWRDATDEVIAAYLRALCDRSERASGRVPQGWTMRGHCVGCGPVWLLPGSIHTALSCPWCWNRIDGLPLPHPPDDAAGSAL